jgi:3-methyladenine DNA glycosylase AlkD
MSAAHELIEKVRAELRQAGDRRTRDSIARFFTEDQPVVHYGVASPRLKQIAQGLYAQVKAWPAAERDRFCTLLWEGNTDEEGALVCYVYRRFGRSCGPREFGLFTRWLDRFVNNWGHTDGLSLWLLGASIANDASLIGKLDAWTQSKNRWKRRAAAVALVPSARRGLHTREILRIAAPLIPDEDDMVRKGVGWLLKETYPEKPAEVMRFLMPRREQTSRIVLRYAAEKMSAQDRARLLTRDAPPAKKRG